MLTTSPSTELAADLRIVVARTARLLRRESGTDLSPSQAAALVSVELHGPLAPSELADREGVRRPTITRIVARLEERGLLERSADPADGRSVRIAITAAGRELLAASRARRTAYLARHLEGLDADDLAALRRATDVLGRVVDEAARA